MRVGESKRGTARGKGRKRVGAYSWGGKRQMDGEAEGERGRSPE